MAFIKDDIGNWDLKKFDNRPGELVDAYKKAGLAALQEVAKLASGAGNISAANQLLSFSDRLNFGDKAPDSSAVNAQVEGLRERTTNRLTALGESEQGRYEALGTRIGTTGRSLATAQTDLTGLNEALEHYQIDWNRYAIQSA